MIKSLLRMFKYVRELEAEAEKLEQMKRRAMDVRTWCAYEFPEAGCAAKWISNPYDCPSNSGAWGSISHFRESLRDGKCDIEYTISPSFEGMERPE